MNKMYKMYDLSLFRGKAKDIEIILDVLNKHAYDSKLCVIGELNGKHLVGINMGKYHIKYTPIYEFILQYLLREDLNICIGNAELSPKMCIIAPESFKEEYQGLYALYNNDIDMLLDFLMDNITWKN